MDHTERSASPSATTESPALHIDNLSVAFNGNPPTVEDVTLTLMPGHVLAVVGESGCGKSVTSFATMGLLPDNGEVVSGRVELSGHGDLTTFDNKELRKIQGGEIAMIFQEPMTSLNPMMSVGSQVAEAIRTHRGASRAKAKQASISLLDTVGIRNAAQVYTSYPHELSGGMRQRVMIAMAVSCHPKVLIADEPTTALDVSIQAQILDLIRNLQSQNGMAVLLITHDLGVVAEMADRVAVMYAGQVVEETDVFTLFRQPQHPYTRALLHALPDLTGPRDDLQVIPGNVPSPGNMPAGCRFAPRCNQAIQKCHDEPPTIVTHTAGWARCWLPTPQFAPVEVAAHV